MAPNMPAIATGTSVPAAAAANSDDEALYDPVPIGEVPVDLNVLVGYGVAMLVSLVTLLACGTAVLLGFGTALLAPGTILVFAGAVCVPLGARLEIAESVKVLLVVCVKVTVVTESHGSRVGGGGVGYESRQ